MNEYSYDVMRRDATCVTSDECRRMERKRTTWEEMDLTDDMTDNRGDMTAAPAPNKFG